MAGIQFPAIISHQRSLFLSVESWKFYKYKEDVISQIISSVTYGWDSIPSHYFNTILVSKEPFITREEGSG